MKAVTDEYSSLMDWTILQVMHRSLLKVTHC